MVSGRLSRLTADGNTMSSEKVLINDWCQQFPSHSVGDIAFGKDGSAVHELAATAHRSTTSTTGQTGSPIRAAIRRAADR